MSQNFILKFTSLLTDSVGRAEHAGSDLELKNPSHFSTMPLLGWDAGQANLSSHGHY